MATNKNGSAIPAHHANAKSTAFRNPWVHAKSLLESGQVIFNRFPLEWARRLHDHPAKQIQVVDPDFGRSQPDEGRVKATWLGHAVSVPTIGSRKAALLMGREGVLRTISDSRRLQRTIESSHSRGI